MAAYYKVEVSLNTNSVTVGSPSAQEVLVTLPLVGPQGATGPQGPAGAGAVESVNSKTGIVVLDGSDIDTSANDDRAAFVVQSFADGNGIYYPLAETTINGKRVYRTTTGHHVFFENLRWHITDGAPVTANIIESSDDDEAAFPYLSPWSGDVDKAHIADVISRARTTFLFLGDSVPSTSVSGLATVAASGDYDDLTGKPSTFTPSAHKATHTTGGSDALNPADIGAVAAQVLSSQFISGETLLSAGRNRRITLSVVATSNVDLPYQNNANGDVVTLVQGQTGALTATIRAAATISGGVPIAYSTLATLTTAGQSFTFVSDGTATGWTLQSVDTHTQPASTITGLPAASTTTPAALGTAAVGTGATFARADHVHAMPTAANVGAAATVHTHTTNQILEGRQTFNITSTNSASPTNVDAEGEFQDNDGGIDCVVVLNNETGIVYANINIPNMTGFESQSGRVVLRATTSGLGDITYFRIDMAGSIIYPASGYEEFETSKQIVLVWKDSYWKFEDEQPDNVFRVVGSADPTKKLAFELDTLVDTATTRTLTIANRSGVNVVSDTSAGIGSDVVNNIVSLTQAEYNAIGSPDSATLFLITDP